MSIIKKKVNKEKFLVGFGHFSEGTNRVACSLCNNRSYDGLIQIDISGSYKENTINGINNIQDIINKYSKPPD